MGVFNEKICNSSWSMTDKDFFSRLYIMSYCLGSNGICYKANGMPTKDSNCNNPKAPECEDWGGGTKRRKRGSRKTRGGSRKSRRVARKKR
jgi:hypothetical protein